jgi:Chromo (CHRromatin Organisation MOdifier) domain
VRKRGRGQRTEYLVRWTGYTEEDDQWVAEGDIDEQLVKEYHDMVQEEGHD